jgi:hypothetical protein
MSFGNLNRPFCGTRKRTRNHFWTVNARLKNARLKESLHLILRCATKEDAMRKYVLRPGIMAQTPQVF